MNNKKKRKNLENPCAWKYVVIVIIFFTAINVVENVRNGKFNEKFIVGEIFTGTFVGQSYIGRISRNWSIVLLDKKDGKTKIFTYFIENSYIRYKIEILGRSLRNIEEDEWVVVKTYAGGKLSYPKIIKKTQDKKHI